jgi:hypothetical protein
VVSAVCAEERASDMIEIALKDGWYIVTLPKSVLVLTKAEFIHALRQGTWWKRRAAMNARRSPTPKNVMESSCQARGGCHAVLVGVGYLAGGSADDDLGDVALNRERSC